MNGNYLWEVITRIPDKANGPNATMEVKSFYVARTPEEVWEQTATDRMDERTEFIGIFRSVPILRTITQEKP